jgi:hypothetical protein
VLTSHDDNGNRLGRLLGGTDRCKVSADKHIDFELHEFGHKAWDTVQLALSVTILYENVLPLSITEISQRWTCVGSSSMTTKSLSWLFAAS